MGEPLSPLPLNSLLFTPKFQDVVQFPWKLQTQATSVCLPLFPVLLEYSLMGVSLTWANWAFLKPDFFVSNTSVLLMKHL